MKLTFRWYGEKDCIPLNYIKQIQGMTGVVTAVYDVPVGEAWEFSKLERLKSLCNNAGLEMEIIESIPVHEDIKLGKPTRDKLIENYAQNIINCGKVGVKGGRHKLCRDNVQNGMCGGSDFARRKSFSRYEHRRGHGYKRRIGNPCRECRSEVYSKPRTIRKSRAIYS